MKRGILRAFAASVVVTSCLGAVTVRVGAQATHNAYAQHMTISMAMISAADDIKAGANDAVLNYLQQKFNMTIKPVEQTWSNYDQQVNLWAASGQLPDVFFTDEINTPNYFQWINQGLIRALPADLSAYPNVKKLVQLRDMDGYQVNGKLYFIPRQLQASNVLPGDRGIIVRKDWMAKLGIKDPQTWDQFVAMLKAFVQRNPDHSKNVTGVTSNNVGTLEASLYQNWDPYAYWWHKDSSGKWISPVQSPTMLSMIQATHQLYAQGLLDKDYGNPNNNPTTKFIEGQAGAIDQQPKHMDQLQKAWDQVHKDKKFTDVAKILMMPPGPDGHRYAFQYYDFWSESFFNASVDDAKMSRILALYDYLISPAGRKLVNFGFAGKDYKMAGEAIAPMHNTSWNVSSAYPSTGVFASLVVWGEDLPGHSEFKTTNPLPAGSWTAASWKMYSDYVRDYLRLSTAAPVNWAVNTYATSLPHGNDNANTAFVQAVAASNPQQVWQQYLQQENKLGLTAATAQVNQKFK